MAKGKIIKIFAPRKPDLSKIRQVKRGSGRTGWVKDRPRITGRKGT